MPCTRRAGKFHEILWSNQAVEGQTPNEPALLFEVSTLTSTAGSLPVFSASALPVRWPRRGLVDYIISPSD